MATRIVCFVIAIAFMISVLGFSGFLIYDHFTGDDEDELYKTTAEINEELLDALAHYGQLDSLAPLEESLTDLQSEVLSAGEEEALAVVATDTISFSYAKALADTGQIYEISLPEEPASDADLTALVPQPFEDVKVGNLHSSWQEIIIGVQEGSKVRWSVPAEQVLDNFEVPGRFPTQQDIVIDIEIVSITERVVIEGFDPLGEAHITELEIKDVVTGTGAEVVAGDTIVLSYIGVLAESGVSFDHNDEYTALVKEGEFIQGFYQGLLGMQAGGKRQIFIPAELGYGAEGSGSIPADADLVFEVELKEIQPAGTVEE